MFKSVKLSLVLNNQEIIPANLILFDKAQGRIALMACSHIPRDSSVKINFPTPFSFKIKGKVLDSQLFSQRVIKPHGNGVYRIIIAIEN